MASELRSGINKWLRNLLSDKRFGDVLNLGSGNDSDGEGNQYSGYFLSKHLTCLDIKNYGEIDVRGKVYDLPFKKESFDFIFSNLVMYYSLPGDEFSPTLLNRIKIVRYVNEISRVLRNKGSVMISFGIMKIPEYQEVINFLMEYFHVTNSFLIYSDRYYNGFQCGVGAIYGKSNS
jgi:SAM-dependent methyltransferase